MRDLQVDGHAVRPADVLVRMLRGRAARPTTRRALKRLRAHVVRTSGGERVEIDTTSRLLTTQVETDSETLLTGRRPGKCRRPSG